MPKTKRKFIDKKHATTFHLVHRSQHDPLVADENAPQHVLVSASQSQPNKKSNIEEQQKFGIYFDDDYNYLQHLKPVNATDVEWVPVETANKNQQVKKKVTQEPDEEVYRVERPPKLVLPSSVFASEVEEEVGMLNKAAPQGLRLDLDPDIVAAMDEDFDFDDPDNILDDDFIQLANAPGGSDEDDESDGSDTECGSDFNNMSDYEDEALDEVGSLDDGQRSFMEEETKSRFTDYSMSSSVIRRNNQLTLLDDRFENLFSQYDDTKIGPLDQDSDDEDGIGFLEPNSEMVLKCVDEFDKSMAEQKLDKDQELERIARAAADNYESESDDDSYRELRVKEEREDEKWDCQSILSTYSTTSNRPKLISERNGPGKIRISNKTGVPVGVIDANKLTAKALAQLNADQNGEAGDMAGPRRPESIVSMLSTLSVRPKDETPEERKARKKALKEYRRERVIERKANTAAFGEEKKRQEKVMMNNKHMKVVHV